MGVRTTQEKLSFSLPSLMSGSVLFSNGVTIAQDNANFFYDDTNNRLGIGTNTPSKRVHFKETVTSNDYPFLMEFPGYDSGLGYTGGLHIRSTALDGYYGQHFKLSNAAYAAEFIFQLGDGLQLTTNPGKPIYFMGNYGAVRAVVIDPGYSLTLTARFTAYSFNASDTVAVFKGVASQSGDLTQWQNNSGTVLARIKADGTIGITGDIDHDGTNIGFYGTPPTPQATGWTTSNVPTQLRTFDYNTMTGADLIQFVSTNMDDLKLTGILGA